MPCRMVVRLVDLLADIEARAELERRAREGAEGLTALELADLEAELAKVMPPPEPQN